MRASLYAEPELYELLEAPSTPAELDLIERLFAAHGNGGRRALEPACGTGRLLAALRDRGWRADGYDREPKMVAYARRRLRGTAGRVWLGDLRSFRPAGRYDLAFCLQGSIRHLPSDAAASSHLRAVASALAPGGIYLVGMDLADYGRPEPDEETWEAGTVRQAQLSLGPDRRRRCERVLQFISEGERLRSFRYDLRTYDVSQWRAVVERSPFELAATYDPWLKPMALDASTRAATFVLRRTFAEKA